MQPLNKKHVKNLDQNFIKKDQKFSFRCTQCGEWCRNKPLEDRILLSTVDIYRAAGLLELEMQDVIARYCDMVPGRESMLPLMIMKQRLDGSCIFLKKGKCTIQDNKPLVCAMYPLGRMEFLNDETGEYDFHYYVKNFRREGCHAAEDEEWTTQQWLDRFDVEAYDDCVKLYRQLGAACSKLMHSCDTDEEKKEMFGTSFYMMFVKYDRKQPLKEQLAVNLAFVKSLRPSLFFDLDGN